ncbi:unnamed protein product [Microthlaspi erraticum]|uniref:F-box domain-containing protein n=1 Tax=Microthlaspi erraticum TaxID=1685480 RepID=A0A6D2KNQ1_9BRAS|nr:unnamed protein product [Microthlaspi erraticum]
MEETKRHKKGKQTKRVSLFSSQSGSKRRRRREVTEIILNDDALDEIMVRLPVKSLIRFQTVSKDWKRIITSKSFRERHMLHQKTLEPRFLCIYEDRSWYKRNVALKTMRLDWSSTCLVESEEEEEYHTSDNDQDKALLVLSSPLDGLVCFYNHTDLTRPIKVINPATRWSLTLPLAKIQVENLDKSAELPPPGFGKDYVTGTYKLILLHYINDDDNTSSSSCEVFDFGIKQWKQVMPPPLDHGNGIHNGEPTFANGWLYWFSQDKTKLVAFDLHMEMFRVFPNPITVSSSPSSLYMRMGSVDDERRLVWISVTSGDGKQQHVWRLTNHNTGGALSIMDKMFSFELNKIGSTWFDDHHPFHTTNSLLNLMAVSKNGNKVVLSKYGSLELFLYHPINPTSALYRNFSFSPPRPTDSALLPYFPSLASPL